MDTTIQKLTAACLKWTMYNPSEVYFSLSELDFVCTVYNPLGVDFSLYEVDSNLWEGTEATLLENLTDDTIA